MARTEGRIVSASAQTRYSTSAIKALGLREENEIMKYAQKVVGGISNKNLKQVVFYQMLKDANSVQEVATGKNHSLGATWNGANGSFDKVKGFNGTEILRAILAFCKRLTSTYYIAEDEYSETALDFNGAIVEYQASDMNEKLESVFLNKLKSLADGTLTLNLYDGTTLTNQGIPTANVYGDKTVEFEKGTNLFKFREMLAKAKVNAGRREIFMVGGYDLLVLIETATRFVNHDWVASTSKKGGMSNGMDILSASKEILNTKYIILRDFDTVFPRTGAGTDECKIFVGTQNAFGFDRSGKPKTQVVHIPQSREVMIDMVLDYAIEITDPIGFYSFAFKYGVG